MWWKLCKFWLKNQKKTLWNVMKFSTWFSTCLEIFNTFSTCLEICFQHALKLSTCFQPSTALYVTATVEIEWKHKCYFAYWSFSNGRYFSNFYLVSWSVYQLEYDPCQRNGKNSLEHILQIMLVTAELLECCTSAQGQYQEKLKETGQFCWIKKLKYEIEPAVNPGKPLLLINTGQLNKLDPKDTVIRVQPVDLFTVSNHFFIVKDYLWLINCHSIAWVLI